MPHTNNKKAKPEKFKYSTGKRAPVDPKKASRPPKRKLEAEFDDEARRDYLTGFSKRKKARKETAAARAEEKDRQARNEMRQELRDQRKEQAQKNVEAASLMYGDPLGDSEPDQAQFDLPSQQAEAETQQDYQDEDVQATVTIEEVDLNADPEEPKQSGPHFHPSRVNLSRASKPPPRTDRPKMTTKGLVKKKATKANPHHAPRPAYTSKAERKRGAANRKK